MSAKQLNVYSPYVTLKPRILAFLLDYVIIAVYGIFVLGTLSSIFQPFMTSLFSDSAFVAQLAGFLLITLPVSLYFIFCESSRWQGTWGKRKMGIRVVNMNNQRIGICQAIIRTIIKFLPWECAHFAIWRLMLPTNLTENTIIVILIAVNCIIITYLIFPLFNKKRRNIYDFVARTVVVK